MRLCITEKREVAVVIAKVMGAKTDQKDWFEGNGLYVTWCKGHLLELRVKESEGAWTLSNLPILPDRFELGPISSGRDKDGNYIENANCKHRLYVIRQLIQKSDEIICGTDAGREGQLIFENVYRYVGIRKPCKRLWISALTEKAIRNGFDNLADNGDYAELGLAARLRSEGDWIIGINATRAFTLTANSSRPLSLGRVQTPTLCMICQRFRENRDFRSEPFWFLSGQTRKNETPVKYRCDERYADEERAKTRYNEAKAVGTLTVDTITTERKNEDAPLLHDVASLQKIANSKYGLTAKQTLDAAQSLYEQRLISYPRTGSRYISKDVFQEIPEIIKSLTGHHVYGEDAKRILSGTLNKRSVDDEKVTDHHGLILTTNSPGGLTQVEAMVYELVLTRFLEAFSPMCVADVTEVQLSAGDVSFVAKGRREISLGWRAVCKDGDYSDVSPELVDEVEMTMNPLPLLEEGEKLPLGELEIIKDMTKPKPLLTDATLISCMENAGKRVDDKSLSKALKGIGIGTAATRHDVIEEVINRGYAFRDKKKIIPTELGLSVYEAVKDKEIANVEMTAKWESDLNDIAEGDTALGDSFLSGIKGYALEITTDICSAEDIKRIGQQVQAAGIKCPTCGKHIQLREIGGKCECGFTAWRTISSKRLSDEQMKQLYEDGRTEVIKGFKGKSGNIFSAALTINDGKLAFVFPEKVSEDALKCPKCGEPMRFSEKSVWCPKCKFAVWREVCQKKLTDKQLSNLVLKGRTGVLTGFVSKAGKTFDAKLVLQDDGRVKFEFENKK